MGESNAPHISFLVGAKVMKDIHQLVHRVSLRLGWDHANKIIARALLVAVGAASLGILCEKLFFIGMPVLYALMGVFAVCVVAVVVLAIRDWPSRRLAALEIDDRLRLGERVSSAIAVADDGSPMAQAVVRDSQAYARSVPVTTTFPMRMHREFWFVFLVAFVAIGLLGLMPQLDLLARRATLEKRQKEQAELQREAQRMRRKIATLRKKIKRPALKRAEGKLKELEKIVGKMERGKISRAEALAKLSELGKSLKEQYKHMEEKKLNYSPAATKQQMKYTKDLAKALEDKDFAKAAEELKALAQKAGSGKMSKQEMEQLNKELQQLAKALGKGTKLPEALQDMADALNEADMQQLQKKLKEGLAKGEFDLKQAAEMAKELEAMQEFAKIANGAGNQLGNRTIITDTTGIFSPGDERGQGSGMGGPGSGMGGIAPIESENVAFQPGKLKGQMQKGRIVGSYFADGKSLKGEARVEFADEATAAESEAAQALDSEKIPRAYEGYVREYFHGMKNY